MAGQTGKGDYPFRSTWLRKPRQLVKVPLFPASNAQTIWSNFFFPKFSGTAQAEQAVSGTGTVSSAADVVPEPARPRLLVLPPEDKQAYQRRWAKARTKQERQEIVASATVGPAPQQVTGYASGVGKRQTGRGFGTKSTWNRDVQTILELIELLEAA